jgi:hypothetical protein
MTGTSAVELYYEPYDVEIDDNPYVVWKHMRDAGVHPMKRNFPPT